MSHGLIIFYGKTLLMFQPLYYHFPLSESVRAFYHGPLPGSEELCLSEALTTVFSALYQALMLGCITAVEELTRHCMRSLPDDGVVLVGNHAMIEQVWVTGS